MGTNSFCRGVLLGFLVSLLFAGTFCQADDKSFEVVGEGECTDCQEKNIQTNHAFLGLQVSIDCKGKDGKFKCKGEGELDQDGKFKVILSEEMQHNVDDKEECYAQLHNAFSAPCPAHDGLEASKIVAKFDADGKFTLEPVTRLKFSTSLCTSATLWPYHNFPPSPEIDSWKKHFSHHLKVPPFFKKPAPPSEPKKPKPEPKKPEQRLKRSKPSAPKKSEPKKQKPQAPKKPFPPSEPKKPEPPISKPPSEKPPVSKKPCPSIPKVPKFPGFPKFPPKKHDHPKFPYFPLPPQIPLA